MGYRGANLAYVHSQMNPQTCTEFGANRSISLAAFTDLNLWPRKTPKMPPCGELYLYMSIPRRIRRHVSNLVPIIMSISLTASPDIWICDPLKPPKMPPVVLWGDLYLVYVHSQMNQQTWTKVDASRLTASPVFLMFDPLKPHKFPLVSRRAICLAYIHSEMNLHHLRWSDDVNSLSAQFS